MRFSVVWLDLKKAKIFHLSEDQMAREEFQRPAGRAHPRGEEAGEPAAMCDEIARRIAGSSRVLILGPGPAKTQLLARFEARFPEIAEKVVGCETADHPTDAEIAASAAKYFQKRVG